MTDRTDFQLIDIVQVVKSDRVYCQAENCKHSVFRKIHLVRECGVLKLYGSSCFAKKFHALPTACKVPWFSSGVGGRLLSSEERQMLITNTERLLVLFEAKYNSIKAEEARRQQEARELSERNVEAKMTVLTAHNLHLQKSKDEWRRKFSPNKIRESDRFDEKFLIEVRSFEIECKTMNPRFNESLFMRCMWKPMSDANSHTIREYFDGNNRTRIIDIILRYFELKTSSDPWAFSAQLQTNYAIPKIVTYQVLSDFGLLRSMQEMAVSNVQ